MQSMLMLRTKLVFVIKMAQVPTETRSLPSNIFPWLLPRVMLMQTIMLVIVTFLVEVFKKMKRKHLSSTW